MHVEQLLKQVALQSSELTGRNSIPLTGAFLSFHLKQFAPPRLCCTLVLKAFAFKTPFKNLEIFESEEIPSPMTNAEADVVELRVPYDAPVSNKCTKNSRTISGSAFKGLSE